MKALRLLHFADLHLGVQTGGRPDPATGLNRRIVDVCDRLDELCAVAESEEVHAVLFAGDAFNNQHPNPTLQSLFASRIRRLARGGTAVFLLIGNHDLPKSASFKHPFSIYEALDVEGVVVGDRAQVYRLPMLRDSAPASELQVAAIPHFSRHQALANAGDLEDPDAWIAQQFAAKLDELCRDASPDLPSVFVGHLHVNKAEVGRGQSFYGVSDVEIPLSQLASGLPFPYFALGHVHKKQVLSSDPFVAYAGSLERVDHGEGTKIDIEPGGKVTQSAAEPKGFFRFDLTDDGGWKLATTPTFREVAARPFVTLGLGEIDPRDPVADVTARLDAARKHGVDLSDAFVRITGRIEVTDRGRLTTASVRDLIGEAYDVRLEISTAQNTLVRDPRFAERMTEIEALHRFLETHEEWSEDADELLRLGRELIAETL